MSKMVRISIDSDKILNKLSKEVKISKQKIIANALDLLHRKYFMEKANQQYLALSNKEKKEIQKESAEWDSTLLDELENE